MNFIPEPWLSITQGAFYGACLGGGGAAIFHFMNEYGKQPIDLKVTVKAVQNNKDLCRLLAKFTPLRDLSAQTRTLYDKMIRSCDELVNAEFREVKGADQLQASRLALLTVSSAKALCNQAVKLTQKGVPCESDPFDVMREIETLEGQVNNHLHNIMLT